MSVGIGTAILSLVQTVISGYQKRSEAKTEAKTNWEVANVEAGASSWKDEACLIFIVLMPYIMCFFPQTQDIVQNGFIILEHLPNWLQVLIPIVVLATFGIRTHDKINVSKLLGGK